MPLDEAKEIILLFPLLGNNNVAPRNEQPPQTTPVSRNVWPVDRTSVMRGAQRIGTLKVWGSAVPDS